MRKNILVFGSISGAISAVWFVFGMMLIKKDPSDMTTGMILGYAAMLVSNIFLFIGVKNYRDKFNNGVISFGKALGVGLLIALVAATFYVLVWEVYYYSGGGRECMDVFREAQLIEWTKAGMSEAKIADQLKEFDQFLIAYQNPFFNAIITYTEILPVGILCSLIVALILKRKTPKKQNPEIIDSNSSL